MRSQQQSAMSSTRVVQANRSLDHVYDPTFTIGSQKTQMQLSQQAKMNSVERVPAYQNMFSDNQRYPRHLYRVKAQATIPLNVGQTSSNPLSNAIKAKHDMAQTSRNAELGSDRLKFFTRPVLPFLQAVPAQVLVTGAEPAQQPGFENAVEEEARTKSMGVQSTYRESGAQTEPYTRDYITAEGEAEPEILSIAHLTFGAGLPASLDEINLIHRMREKRAFEASLPPVTDEASFQLRKRMLEERELKEWQIREDAMKKEQESKLQKLIDTLKQREEKKEALSEARVEIIRQEKALQRDRKFAQLHHERIKVHRGLGKARRTHGEKQSNKRDIIAEHTQYGSKVYAPNARDGRLAVKNQVVDYGIPLINNYQGLLTLEKGVSVADTTTDVREPSKILLTHEKTRKGQKILNDLEYCSSLLNNTEKDKDAVKIENVYKKFEPVLRASTPHVTVPEDDEQQRVVLLLQRLLRGRAVQNKMYQGKERAIHLIRELRLAENHIPSPREDPERAQDVALDTLQGEVVSKALDFITKEIQRMAEEKRVARLVEVATETRRVREAEEAGRRQAEYLKAKKTETYHKALLDVNQNSAERYLDELFDNAVETVAANTAEKESVLKSHVLDDMVMSIENENNSPEIIVNELLTQFLFPEVKRRHDKANNETAARAYHDSAHHIVTHLVSEVAAQAKPERPTRMRSHSRQVSRTSRD